MIQFIFLYMVQCKDTAINNTALKLTKQLICENFCQFLLANTPDYESLAYVVYICNEMNFT